MSPGWAFVGGALTAIAVLIGILLIVDHFWGPLPTFRKYRDKAAVAAAVIGTLGLYLLFRKKKVAPDDTPEPKPKEFDDAEVIEDTKDAADLDLDRANAERAAADAASDVVDLDARAAQRDAALRELERTDD